MAYAESRVAGVSLAVRYLEDALSRELGLAQTVRGTANLAALADPDCSRIHAAHDRVVDRAVTVLTTARPPLDEEWLFHAPRRLVVMPMVEL